VGGFEPVTARNLEAVAARHGATTPQVALAWLLARSPNILLIPGTGSPAHLEENLAAGTLTLTAQDMADLG
jgi:aryl-alcohol dehydrogenase-like predicted oxidoreductase